MSASNPNAAQETLTARIDVLLPQTQCRKCGYDGCRPYARAIAAGKADINQCPPGGTAAIARLAELLGREPKPLNPDYGNEQLPQVAMIDESACIGCVKCIEACPVDAILGARKQMHTIIQPYCTGCELCIEPCPVDCIRLVPAATTGEHWQITADRARARFMARQTRLQAQTEEQPAAPVKTESSLQEKRDYIQAAVERTRLKRQQRQQQNIKDN